MTSRTAVSGAGEGNKLPTSVVRQAGLVAHIEHFRSRVLQDALLEATANYWIRRADTFTAVGNPRCDQIALACRRHATLAPLNDDELVAAALGEVA